MELLARQTTGIVRNQLAKPTDDDFQGCMILSATVRKRFMYIAGVRFPLRTITAEVCDVSAHGHGTFSRPGVLPTSNEPTTDAETRNITSGDISQLTTSGSRTDFHAPAQRVGLRAECLHSLVGFQVITPAQIIPQRHQARRYRQQSYEKPRQVHLT